MEDKLISSSDIGLLFANVLNNILSDNCNLLKNLIFLVLIPTMNCLRWYGSSAHLINCAFDQTRCAADHFINFAAFDELRNICQSRSALAIRLD